MPIADFSSGLYGAFAIASLLSRVRMGGSGGHIDVPMFGCTLGVAALQTSEFFGTGKSPGRLGSAHPRNAPYQAFAAADGHFAIAAGNQKLWKSVCLAVDMPELETDPRFLTTSDRAKNQVALKDILELSFIQRSVDEWIAVFNQAGVPHARINDYEAALNDPQVKHMEWIRAITLPGGGKANTFGSPLLLNGASLPIRHNPPGLGEHTDAVSARLLATAATGKDPV